MIDARIAENLYWILGSMAALFAGLFLMTVAGYVFMRSKVVFFFLSVHAALATFFVLWAGLIWASGYPVSSGFIGFLVAICVYMGAMDMVKFQGRRLHIVVS